MPNFLKFSLIVKAAGESINDSYIETRNNVLRKEDAACEVASLARRIWEFGKVIGVEYEGNEESIIQRIVEMNLRDMQARAWEHKAPEVQG
ncbi:hypothetical protein Ancab_029563 [Ancistrocladus abbreviatus]